MTKQSVYEAARQSLLPVLVDNTREAHRLSVRLFHQYGVVSLIFGKPRLWDLFDLSSRTLRLPQTASERLRIEELTELAQQSTSYLPVLIPCSDASREWIARHAATLESHYILADAETIFSLPLLTEDGSSGPHLI